MSWLLCALIGAAPAQAAPGLRLVVLDPGHGGTNLGAPARYHRGRYEKEFSLLIARRVAEHLRGEGVQVVLTRLEDRDMTLKERIGLANKLSADLFLSVHLNATERPGPSGHETFFLSLDATDEAAKRLAAFENSEPATLADAAGAAPVDDAVGDILLDLTRNRAHADAERLAALIQARLAPRSPFQNRGVKQAPFFVLMGAAMPAVVTEVGFINHPQEGRFITSDEGIKDLALGIAEGILDFGRLVLAPRAKTHDPAETP
ncbi:MAG: N-acetylmuramoyl-L-alanine amidase [Myxococcales bacterium]|nr:N-acetylmuramoyl-L-alanine amidase [Myxococcales bacterium]